MTRYRSVADRVDTVVDGILHWTVQDERIDFRGDAYAVLTERGSVLIDPVPLTEAALKEIGRPVAVCLTSEDHQRSAWTFRRLFDIDIFAPVGARNLEEPADLLYRQGDTLPGDLLPVKASACGPVHYVLVLERSDAGPVMFCGDLVIREDGGPFFVMPDYYVQEPSLLRESIDRMITFGPEVICPAHGSPLAGGGKTALQDALRRATT